MNVLDCYKATLPHLARWALKDLLATPARFRYSAIPGAEDAIRAELATRS